jgi:hypothetical protein
VSTPDPNDLRDPRFDAAWRTASNEEPPATLDDAIRAAARREVSAGPQSIKPRASSRSALSPQRWWAPLAAAATIGAIAVGVLQLASPDKVVAPAIDKAVVSDMPAPTASAVAPAPPSSVGATAPVPAITAPPAEQRTSASPGNADERAARPRRRQPCSRRAGCKARISTTDAAQGCGGSFPRQARGSGRCRSRRRQDDDGKTT